MFFFGFFWIFLQELLSDSLQKVLSFLTKLRSEHRPLPSKLQKVHKRCWKNIKFLTPFGHNLQFQTNLQNLPPEYLSDGHPDTLGLRGRQRDEIFTRYADRLRPSLEQLKINPSKYCREGNI